MTHGLLAGDLAFLSPGFLSIGRHKLDLIKTLLSYKVNLVISDVDTGQWSLHVPYTVITWPLHGHSVVTTWPVHDHFLVTTSS